MLEWVCIRKRPIAISFYYRYEFWDPFIALDLFYKHNQKVQSLKFLAKRDKISQNPIYTIMFENIMNVVVPKLDTKT